jgi:hypothetical protein
MSHSYDETHWYHKGWKRLRGQTVTLAIALLPGLVTELQNEGTDPEDAARRYIDTLIQTIGGLIDGVIDEQLATPSTRGGLTVASSLWSYVLPLLGDTDALCTAIAQDARLISGQTNRDVSPEAAVGKLVLSHINTARLQIDGGSANRLKNWETIQRISSLIVRKNPQGELADRRSITHLAAVQALLYERYKSSKNVHLSLGTLQAYFDEFSLDPGLRVDIHTAEDLVAVSEETDLRPGLGLCLQNLHKTSEDDWEATLVSHKFDDIEVMTREKYQTKKGITRHEFDKRCARALRFLRDCLSKTINFQLLRER